AGDRGVDLGLVFTKARSKGFRWARRESLENVHLASLLILRGRLRRGYIPEWTVQRSKRDWPLGDADAPDESGCTRARGVSENDLAPCGSEVRESGNCCFPG